MTGFWGKILWVDLSNETFKEEKLDPEMYKKYIGGYGLACKLIYDNTPAKYDPLGPEAIFGFFPGLLGGTTAPFSGRYMVAGKSPLTGTWGDANSGGNFAPAIKKCGYDAILFKGKAQSPKYVAIIGEDKQILDASDIWSLDYVEADIKLKAKHGKFVNTAGIGQAGANLSLIAGIVNNKGRIAARSGLGAVMGSKNLKMLVLKGKEQVPVADKAQLKEIVMKFNSKKKNVQVGWFMKRAYKIVPRFAKLMRRMHIGYSVSKYPGFLIGQLYRMFGSSVANTICAEIGDTPIRNWDGIGRYDYPVGDSIELSAVKIIKFKVQEHGCFACPIQCGGLLNVPEIGLEETKLPEYETCAAFGPLLLNKDLMSILTLNDMVNRAGMDSISAGATVAFAIECFENGIITKDDTDGLELKWGDPDSIIELTKKMINREGFGDVLADGVRKAAERIGKGSEKYAMHAHGQELAMHDPRYFKSLAYTYAFDPTPGRHTAASLDFSEMGPLSKLIDGFSLPKKWKKGKRGRAKAQRILTGAVQYSNSLGLCVLTSAFGKYPITEIMKAITGWDVTPNEIIETGLRIQALRQAFTLREGEILAHDELPGRPYGEPPQERGPNKGVTVEYKEFFRDVCEEMGWNPENGYPLKETLKELKLDFVIKDLY